MPDKIIYTNKQMRGDLQEILRQMTVGDFTPDVIVGIARGGLVPATMLSHYLGKPLQVINYSLRDNKVSHVSEVADVIKRLNTNGSVLIVDDICDSGDTLAKVYKEIKEGVIDNENYLACLRTAVLWNNVNQDIFEPNYVGREISRADDSRWVIFPYEEWWKA